MTEICMDCGESVALGSGKFVNRIPDLDSIEERKSRGVSFPQGDFTCAECDCDYYDHKFEVAETLAKENGTIRYEK